MDYRRHGWVYVMNELTIKTKKQKSIHAYIHTYIHTYTHTYIANSFNTTTYSCLLTRLPIVITSRIIWGIKTNSSSLVYWRWSRLLILWASKLLRHWGLIKHRQFYILLIYGSHQRATLSFIFFSQEPTTIPSMPEVGVSEEGFSARRFPVTFQD